MKKIKRIMSILILLIMALSIGYLVFTSNRLTTINTENLTALGGVLCQGKIDTILHLV